MFPKPTILALITCSFIGGTILGQSSTQAQNPSFICAISTDQVPTTLAQTKEGPLEVFKWKSNYFPPPYTSMQRCREVSERMNVFKDKGMMDYLTSGRVNNEPVICAGTRCDPRGSNVLLTLRRDQNPNQVLQEINANRVGAAGPSMQLGGGSRSPASRSSGLLQSNEDGTLTFNLKSYLGATATNSPTKPSQPVPSPLFNNSVPAAPAGGANGRW